jgi:hypothetical protein
MKILEFKNELIIKSVKLILLICFVYGFGTVSFSQPQSRVIYGKVIDGKTGQPIVNAKVCILSTFSPFNKSYTLRSDKNGNYKSEPIPGIIVKDGPQMVSLEFQVKVSYKHYFTNVKNFKIKNYDDKDHVCNIVLTPIEHKYISEEEYNKTHPLINKYHTESGETLDSEQIYRMPK